MGEVQRGPFRGPSQFPGWLRSFSAMLTLGWAASTVVAQEPPVTLRFDVVGGTLIGDDETLSSWQLAVASPPPACLDVEVHVVLVSRLADCTENPEYCTRGEASLDGYDGCGGGVLGCEDGEDNDGDDLTDLEDPDCRGVDLWRFSLEADPSFTIEEATTSGTAADLLLFPPGQRDLCSLHGTDPVEAAANGGKSGALSVVALSITSTITLPPVSDTVVLKIRGKLSTEGLTLPGDRTAPSLLRFIPQDETGLATTGNPVNAAVFAGGELPLSLSNATVELVLPEVGNAAFLRGDVDGDGEPTLTDGIALLNFLFLGAKTPECRDAADEDDNGTLDLSDATHLFQFLFRGGDAPDAPGVSTCGIDPTGDVLDCFEYAACPAPANNDCPASEPNTAPLAFCRGTTLDDMKTTVAVGDFDGNGLPDLAAGTSEGLAVSLNLGDGSFTFSHAAAFQGRARDIGLGDIDGDGEVDIVAASGGRLFAMVNLVDGTFTDAVHIEASEPAQTLALADTTGTGSLTSFPPRRKAVSWSTMARPTENSSSRKRTTYPQDGEHPLPPRTSTTTEPRTSSPCSGAQHSAAHGCCSTRATARSGRTNQRATSADSRRERSLWGTWTATASSTWLSPP